MINLFIADDEPEVIEGISTLIDWKKYDINICATAANGEEAIELIKKFKPDIILIDIKMPKYDGLEVIEYARNYGLHFESIILSGYDDFCFAQKAIELKIFNYLLKPCKPQEVLEAVLKAKAILEKERDKQELLSKYSNYFKDTLPIVKERILNEIIYNIRNDNDDLIDLLNKYEINLLSEGLYCLIVLRFDKEPKLSNNIEAYTMACLDIIKEYLENLLTSEVFRTRDDIAIIISTKTILEKDFLNGVLLNIQRLIFDKLEVNIYFGVSNWVRSLSKLKLSYLQAQEEADIKFFADDVDIIYYEEISIDKKTVIYPFDDEKEIIHCLALCNKSMLNEKIDLFLDSLFNNCTQNKWYIKSAIIIFMGNLIKFCYDKNLNMKDIIDNKLFENIFKAERKEQLKNSILNFVYNISSKIEQMDKRNNIVKSAIEYIEKNYNKNISLESVSKEVYVTPTYLSILFKREIGINFIDFLHKYRIQKAQELLKNQNLKTYQVANLVGYNDEKYFSQLFKKYTGLTPSQFRDNF